MSVTTYPLVFSFRDAIVGNGYVALVVANGRVILSEEAGDSIWMFGVQPGGVAGGGRERSEAFREFKKGYLSVLFDIASDAASCEEFEERAKEFFGELNDENLAIWTKAVEDVRAGRLSLPGPRAENSDRWPFGIVVQRIDQRADSSANEFDEIKEAA